MKKLVLMFAAIVAMSFASCGGNTEAAANDSDSVVVDSLDSVVDTAMVDSTVADTVVVK